MTTTATTGRTRQRKGDLIFSGATRIAGFTILLALAGVAIFLTLEGLPALEAGPEKLQGADNIVAYIGPLLFGTLLASAIALLIATPLAVGVALVISHYAPRRVSKSLGYAIDLLAAVPSVVYGLWGIGFLGPQLVPVYEWLEQNVGWLPFFAGPASSTGKTHPHRGHRARDHGRCRSSPRSAARSSCRPPRSTRRRRSRSARPAGR